MAETESDMDLAVTRKPFWDNPHEVDDYADNTRTPYAGRGLRPQG